MIARVPLLTLDMICETGKQEIQIIINGMHANGIVITGSAIFYAIACDSSRSELIFFFFVNFLLWL